MIGSIKWLILEKCSIAASDTNPRNIRITADRVALIDWDEARSVKPLAEVREL